eukprot:66031-Amphidinium_carterae.1
MCKSACLNSSIETAGVLVSAGLARAECVCLRAHALLLEPRCILLLQCMLKRCMQACYWQHTVFFVRICAIRISCNDYHPTVFDDRLIDTIFESIHWSFDFGSLF